MTKWPVQNQSHRTTQKHVEHQDATGIPKKTRPVCGNFFCNMFSRFLSTTCFDLTDLPFETDFASLQFCRGHIIKENYI